MCLPPDACLVTKPGVASSIQVWFHTFMGIEIVSTVISSFSLNQIAHDILTVSAQTGPHRTVGNVSACKCVSDCKARGCQFYPDLVPFFHGD